MEDGVFIYNWSHGKHGKHGNDFLNTNVACDTQNTQMGADDADFF